MPHSTPLIATIVVGLSLAFVLGVLAQRLRMSPLVGCLLAGVAVGPFTPGWVADQPLAHELAEIGVILLMFGVGLHFSMKDLLSVRAIAIPGAVAQIGVATLLGLGLAWMLGWPVPAGVVFGLALSVASTVVLLRAVQERRLIETERRAHSDADVEHLRHRGADAVILGEREIARGMIEHIVSRRHHPSADPARSGGVGQGLVLLRIDGAKGRAVVAPGRGVSVVAQRVNENGEPGKGNGLLPRGELRGTQPALLDGGHLSIAATNDVPTRPRRRRRTGGASALQDNATSVTPLRARSAHPPMRYVHDFSRYSACCVWHIV